MGEDNSLSVARKFANDVRHFSAGRRVEIREWLIEQKEVRSFDQQMCNSNVIWQISNRLNTEASPTLQ